MSRTGPRSWNSSAPVVEPSGRPRLIFIAVGVVVLAGLGAGAALRWPLVARAPTTSTSAATYVGAQSCVTCHRQQYELWKGSDHARAMAAADAQTILGAFDNATFRKDGVTSTLSRREGGYFVRTDGPDRVLREFRIAYTFGATPLQQYLVKFPRGRYQVPSIAWDLYPGEMIDHREPLRWTGPGEQAGMSMQA